MRKILAAVATLGVAGLGVIVPAGSAQAQSHCRGVFDHAASGYFYAFSGYDCYPSIGSTASWDSDWGNSAGPFQGGDTNKATSILNKGTSGMAVQVFNGTGKDWGGGFTCLKRSEEFMTTLVGFDFSSGYDVNRGISSHRWVWEETCKNHFLDS